MPLGLLLQKFTAGLTLIAKTLTPWIQIVSYELTIVERARSAFISYWFGPRLPFDGLSLRARIVNLKELDTQFAAAQLGVPISRGGPNLTSPLAGFAGIVAGLMLTPVGAISGVVLLLRFSKFSVTTLLKALGWVLMSGVIVTGAILAPKATGILLGGGLAAAGFGYGLLAALGDRREIRAVFDILGSLARLANATVAFLGQLNGPRAAVRNPGLARVLRVLDRGAAAFAQVLGAVAFLITRVGPILPGVVRTAMDLKGLITSAGAVVQEVLRDVFDRLTDLVSGKVGIAPLLERVAQTGKAQLARVLRGVMTQLDVLIGTFRALGEQLQVRYDQFLDDAATFLEELFTKHRTGQIIQAFRTQLAIATTGWNAPPTKPPPAVPPPPSPLLPLITALSRHLPPSVRGFPARPALPDAKATRLRLGGAGRPPTSLKAVIEQADRLALASGTDLPIELGPAAKAAARAAGNPPSIFVREWRDSSFRSGAPLPAALVLNRFVLQRFRTSIETIVGRILPPLLRAEWAPRVAGLFQLLDQRMYGDPEADPASQTPTTKPGAGPAETAPLPVVIPQARPVQPLIHTLRLRVPGADRDDVRRFQDLLTSKLRAGTFTVVSGGG